MTAPVTRDELRDRIADLSVWTGKNGPRRWGDDMYVVQARQIVTRDRDVAGEVGVGSREGFAFACLDRFDLELPSDRSPTTGPDCLDDDVGVDEHTARHPHRVWPRSNLVGEREPVCRTELAEFPGGHS